MLLLSTLFALVPGVPGADGAEASASQVITHHGDLERAGVYVDPRLTRAVAAHLHQVQSFQAHAPGSIYAQVLYVPGRAGDTGLVVAATEENVVAAFDAADGHAMWMARLGPPVARTSLPCGNISPLGVTGTPVVDPPSRTLYLDAMTTPDGGVTKRHLVFALSIDDGAVRPGWPVDVQVALARSGQSFEPAVQNQRGALALVKGTLYVPFGGHYGDCGDYRGWLVAIPVLRPDEVTAWRTGVRGGGIWGPSGVASDGDRVYVATGNTFDARSWAGGEAILAFAGGVPLGAAPADFFAPGNWRTLDDGDIDIGGTGPSSWICPAPRPRTSPSGWARTARPTCSTAIASAGSAGPSPSRR